MSFKELCKTKELKEAIMNDIHKVSKECGLHGFEQVRAIYVEATPFSVENDLMTPTFKLKRNKIRDRYEKEIAQLYAELPLLKSKL